jgi:hypothetical protein
MKEVLQSMNTVKPTWKNIDDMVVYGVAELEILWNNFFFTGNFNRYFSSKTLLTSSQC